MPSCTVMTIASRRSISSFVFKAIPLAEFCGHVMQISSVSSTHVFPKLAKDTHSRLPNGVSGVL